MEFNEMRNMVMNHAFEYLREVIKNANGSVVAQRGVIAALKYRANSRFLPRSSRSRELLQSQAHVKYVFMPEQPFMINPGISSSPADREGFSRLMALRTSSSETRERDKVSEDCGKGWKSTGHWILKTD
jgi:hypothetical protein